MFIAFVPSDIVPCLRGGLNETAARTILEEFYRICKSRSCTKVIAAWRN